jgi:copper homeostasis protein CutC
MDKIKMLLDNTNNTIKILFGEGINTKEIVVTIPEAEFKEIFAKVKASNTKIKSLKEEIKVLEKEVRVLEKEDSESIMNLIKKHKK